MRLRPRSAPRALHGSGQLCFPQPRPLLPAPLGVGFSAGGLLFPYYVGVVEALRDAQLLTDDTQLAGASAGSLIAAVVATKMDLSDVMEVLRTFSADLRANGTRGRLREALQKTLLSALPSDSLTLANKRLHVAVTRFTGTRLVGELFTDFESQEDLCEALLTSCHIPFYSDKASVARRFRGDWCCDGGLTNFLPVAPDVAFSIRVCCFPAYSAAAAVGAQGLVDIAPDAPGVSGAPIDAPYSTAKMLQWALTPADDATMEELRTGGRVDTQRWLERHSRAQDSATD
jgi:hypothetical protein